MSLDPEQTVAELKELRELTGDENGAQRVAWTDTWLKAREWFQPRSKACRLSITTTPQAITGSRCRANPRRRCSSAVILILCRTADGWTDAWMCWPGSKCCADSRKNTAGARRLPSAWWTGPMRKARASAAACWDRPHSPARRRIEADRGRTDKDGIRLEDAVRRCGFEIERFPEATREQKNAAAYIELHIEQGPVLESMDLPLGVVLGTKGVERHAITFLRAGGAFGIDADECAPRRAGRVREAGARNPRHRRKHADAVCTMGSVKTFPGIVTAVVGRCEATLDQRDLDAQVLATMFREAREASERFAREERCTVEWSRIWQIEPIAFHPTMLGIVRRGDARGRGRRRITCRPGRCTMPRKLSRAGIPTVMMFVQSVGGISHNKIEDTQRRAPGDVRCRLSTGWPRRPRAGFSIRQRKRGPPAWQYDQSIKVGK